MKGTARALLAAEVLGFGLAPECSVFVWKDDCPETSDWILFACGFQEGLPPSGPAFRENTVCVPRTLLPTAFIECWFNFKRMAFLRPVEAKILHGLVSLAAVGTQCLRFLRFGARK